MVMAAVGADLAGREEAVRLHDQSSVPLRLVAELLQQCADGRVPDGARLRTQFVHASHVQPLDGQQHGVLADQQAAQLVMGVLPQAGDATVDGAYALLCLTPAAFGDGSFQECPVSRVWTEFSGVPGVVSLALKSLCQSTSCAAVHEEIHFYPTDTCARESPAITAWA